MFRFIPFIILISTLYAQNPEWKVYNSLPSNYVLSIAVEKTGNIWIGTFEGLVKFDGTDWVVYNPLNSGLPDDNIYAIAIDNRGNRWVGTEGGLAKFDGVRWTVYNTLNSDLPNNVVRAIAVEKTGDIWVGTAGGLAKFDGVNWTVYNTSNSGLPHNYIKSIAIDNSGNKWIGTWGLAKFDGINWTVYNTLNSGLPSDLIYAIAIDDSGNKWIRTWDYWVGQKYFIGGLAKFDGENWTLYNTSNSNLPNNEVWAIAIDDLGNKWIGTNGGLVKFDGVNWTIYNYLNSGLPSNYVRAIAIDKFGNKWIGTYGGGVAVYREGGVKIQSNFSLYQNYPNPFNIFTAIEFNLPEKVHVKLSVYDVLGREVEVLVDEELDAGRYKVRFGGGNLSSGVYFYELRAGWFRDVKKMVLVK